MGGREGVHGVPITAPGQREEADFHRDNQLWRNQTNPIF